MIINVRGFTPQLGENVFIAEGAKVIGDVVLGDRSSVWFNSVLRGDVAPIRIGTDCNIQDLSMVHGTFNKCGTTLGDRVTVGHSVNLHGTTIGNKCLIGMGSIVMDLSQIGELSVVGAGSLITENSQFPARSLILGRPGKFIRELTAQEIEFLDRSADNYILYSSWYKELTRRP